MMSEQAASRTPPPALTLEQRSAFYVLGYLFLRMGLFERSRRVFSALAALNPKDHWAQRNLAAIAMHAGDGAAALSHLQQALHEGPLSTSDAALHLIRAKALWLEGRKDEAKNAVNEFMHLTGGEE